MDLLMNIGMSFPEFKKKAVVSLEAGKEYKVISRDTFDADKPWMVMFWWPKDFSGLCPTELVEFNRLYDEFGKRKTTLLGASTDSEFVHLAWRKHNPDLKDLQYPILADTSKSLAKELGILEANEKIAYRATFIVNPEGIIKWVSVYDLSIGRNVDEVIRTLDALQTGGFCPCNWQPGQKTL